MSHRDVLTVAFLQAHGVVPPKPLRDWLTRVSFLARAQPDDAAKVRYEKWALHTIEEAVNAPGGVYAVKWAKQSTMMPPHTPEQTPLWWPDTSSTAVPPSSSAARDALLAETLQRAPAELEPYVQQGFLLYDREVARGQRTYEQVTFVEMLNIARSLHAKAPPPQEPEPRHFTEKTSAPSPPPAPASVVVEEPASAPRPYTHAYPAVAAAAAAAEAEAEASTSHLAASSSSSSPPPPAYKRSAPSTSSYEPPTKKYFTNVAGSSPMADRLFFYQLSGTSEEEKPPQPVFVGRSEAMERAYTRYEPLVDDIRPLPVLINAFHHILQRAQEVEASENKKAGQKYLSDQLKGLRQDLRVQNIVNDFTVHVYETHARLCLETGDIGEFNQCQAALKQFYKETDVDLHRCHYQEFFLYRIVYLTLSEQYDSLSTELITFTNAQLKGTTRPGAEIDKAAVNATLALCNACINGDTATICRLLLLDFAVKMSHLVRIYLQKLRIMWLKEILTAMKGSLTLRFLMASLGFTPLVSSSSSGSGSGSTASPAPFWLDGSQDEASAQLTDLFKTLKITLPDDFVFEAEVARTKHTGPNPLARFPSLDAAAALKAVDEYLLYLGTRKDAGLG